MLIGIVFVIIFLSILILVHELGHFFSAKKFGLLIEEFGFGLPPKIWGKKIGETNYSINTLPFGGFVKIFGENREENSGVLPERSFGNLKIWQRAVIISSGVIMNFLLGWISISIVFAIGIPQAVIITNIQENSPAEIIGLQGGDKIVGFNKTVDFIEYTNSNRGKTINLKIERAGEILEFQVIPRIDPPIGQGALGINLTEAGLPKQNIIMSFWEGLKASVEIVKTIFTSLFDLIVKAFIGKASFESVAGPIGIVKLTAQASNLGLIYLLQLLGLISLNLAVINIFPFPALDGGRLVFLAIEKIKGSPTNHKFERIVNSLGLALLIFLMIVITIKDILRF
ncbi:MAG: RIP metalloprotease RseP [Patescibacteria group bacterium]